MMHGARILLSSLLALAPMSAALAGEPPPAPNRPFDVALDTPPPGAAVRLKYSAPNACPEEPELRSIVASRMGHDPFVSSPGPARELELRVVRVPGGFAGTVKLRELDGRTSWERPPLTDPDCRRLVSVLGGISVRAAIDAPPLAPVAPPFESPIQPTPEPRPDAPSSALPALRVGARAGVAIGVLPGPTGAFSVDVGAGWPFVSVALEGLATLPVQREVESNVTLRSSLFAASIVPCGHYRWLTGCGVLSVGALRAQGIDVTAAAESTGVYVAAGLRAAFEWPIVSALALRLSADALVNLHPLATHVLVGRTPATAQPVEVWRSGPFATVLAAGLVLRFGGAKEAPLPRGVASSR